MGDGGREWAKTDNPERGEAKVMGGRTGIARVRQAKRYARHPRLLVQICSIQNVDASDKREALAQRDEPGHDDFIRALKPSARVHRLSADRGSMRSP